MEGGLALAVDRGVRIVVNAGGLNPACLTARLRELADKLGVTARFAYVAGDDLTARAGELGLGTDPGVRPVCDAGHGPGRPDRTGQP